MWDIKKPEFDEGRTQADIMFYSYVPRRVGGLELVD